MLVFLFDGLLFGLWITASLSGGMVRPCRAIVSRDHPVIHVIHRHIDSKRRVFFKLAETKYAVCHFVFLVRHRQYFVFAGGDRSRRCVMGQRRAVDPRFVFDRLGVHNWFGHPFSYQNEFGKTRGVEVNEKSEIEKCSCRA